MQLKVNDISFSYTGFKALKHISFEVASGDMLAIIGQNGSGKSTLLKCLNRILKISDGTINIGNLSLKDYSPRKLSRTLAYIPQSEETVNGISVFDTVLLGRKPYISSKPTPADMELVAQLLARLDLESIRGKS